MSAVALFLSKPPSNGTGCFRGGELLIPGGMQRETQHGQRDSVPVRGETRAQKSFCPSCSATASVSGSVLILLCGHGFIYTLSGPWGPSVRWQRPMCLSVFLSPLNGRTALVCWERLGVVGVPTSWNCRSPLSKKPTECIWRHNSTSAQPSPHLTAKLSGLQPSEQ